MRELILLMGLVQAAGCSRHFEFTAGPGIVGFIDDIDRIEVRSLDSVVAGTTAEISAVAVLVDSTAVTITSRVVWTVSDESVLTVEVDDGFYAAHGLVVGSAEVTATAFGITSEASTIEVLERMGEVTHLTSVVTSFDSIRLDWGVAPGAVDGHRLVYGAGVTAPDDCDDQGAITVYPETSSESSTVTIEGLDSVTSYAFRVCGVNTQQSPAISAGLTSVATTGQRVFATSLTYTGALLGTSATGVAGADAKCQSVAGANSMGGTWRAVLSSSAATAAGRIAVVSRVFNVRPKNDGGPELLAENAAGFWAGSLLASAEYSETRSFISGAVWTGTNSVGSGSGMNCANWADGGVGNTGTVGDISKSDSNWINAGNQTCDVAARIYCIDGQ